MRSITRTELLALADRYIGPVPSHERLRTSVSDSLSFQQFKRIPECGTVSDQMAQLLLKLAAQDAELADLRGRIGGGA